MKQKQPTITKKSLKVKDKFKKKFNCTMRKVKKKKKQLFTFSLIGAAIFFQCSINLRTDVLFSKGFEEATTELTEQRAVISSSPLLLAAETAATAATTTAIVR